MLILRGFIWKFPPNSHVLRIRDRKKTYPIIPPRIQSRQYELHKGPSLVSPLFRQHYTIRAWHGSMIQRTGGPTAHNSPPGRILEYPEKIQVGVHKSAVLGDRNLLYKVTKEVGPQKMPGVLATKLHGMTPLHYAYEPRFIHYLRCLFGHIDIVKDLVDMGADPTVLASSEAPVEAYSGAWPLSSGRTSGGYLVDLNDQELTTIHLACSDVPGPDINKNKSERDTTRANLISYLAERGVDPHAFTKVNKMTALHYAAIFGLDACCRRLFELGLRSMDRETSSGDTALSLAVKEGHASTVRTLVRWGDGDMESYHHWGGYHLLHLAIDKGHKSVAKALLDLGADVNAPTSHDEETPLLLATRKGDLEMVKLILDHNPDLEHRNVSGMTALHIAYSLGNFEIASLLLKRTSNESV